MILPLFPEMIPSFAPACSATTMRGKLGSEFETSAIAYDPGDAACSQITMTNVVVFFNPHILLSIVSKSKAMETQATRRPAIRANTTRDDQMSARCWLLARVFREPITVTSDSTAHRMSAVIVESRGHDMSARYLSSNVGSCRHMVSDHVGCLWRPSRPSTHTQANTKCRVVQECCKRSVGLARC